MRILITSLILIMLFGSIYVGNSYAFTPAPNSDPTLPQISAQVVVRDSAGNLVAYIEPSVFYIRNIVNVHNYLHQLQPQTITKDGKTLYVYKIDSQEGFRHFGQYTQDGLYYNNDSVLTFSNNGFLAKPGDSLYISWKIISTY